MKKITVISSFLLACVASSCRNEDVYVAEDARQAKYNQEWVNKYGPIDPNQTFNMAETKDMSITVSEDSNVKIYFESDGKRFIAADYQLKSGTTSVKFDVPAGVECIQVIKDSPKRTAQSIFTAVKPHMEISFSEEICMSRVGEEEVPANAIREIKLDTPSLTLPNCYVLTAEATGSTNSITSQLPHDVFWDVYSTDSSMPFMAEENRNDYKNLESYHGIGDIVFETTGGPVSITYLGGKTQQKPSLGYFYLPDEDFEKLNGMSNLDERNELLNSYKRYYFIPSLPDALKKIESNIYNIQMDKYKETKGGIEYRKGVKYKLIYFNDLHPNGTYNFPKGYKIVFFLTINFPIKEDGSVFHYGNDLVNKLNPQTSDQWHVVVMNYSISSVSSWNKNRKFCTYPDKVSEFWTARLQYKGYTFFGFEDNYDASADDIKDFNDAIFTIDGAIDETDIPDITPGSNAPTYAVAFEDMGATGDFDFNDVVLKLSYVAGEQNLYGQLCALGGTLETYLKFNQKNGEASVGDVIDVFAENGSKKELHSVLSGYDTKGDFKCLNTYNCKKRSRLLQQKRRCCYSSDVAKLMFSS